METRTLLLNSWGLPHAILSWQDAICLVYQEKVTVQEEYDEIISSPSTSYFIPAVVQLKHAVTTMKKGVKFSRINIFTRDGFRCFGAGTRILMADGQQIPIEKVRPEDRVIDAFGQPQTVTSIGNRIEEKAIRIKHRGSFEWTTTTIDHPFLQPSGEFVPIGENPEYLVFPRIVNYEPTSLQPYQVADALPKDTWFRFKNGRIYWSRRGFEAGLPTSLPISKEMSYFLGLYCAEGSSTSKGLVALSFNSNERDTLAEDARVLLNSLFGLEASVDLNEEKHVCVVRVGSKTLAKVLTKLCGKGAQNKKVPWDLIGPYRSEFLRGLFAGDGCIDRLRKKVVLGMTAYDCIFGAQSLLWGLGVFPSVSHSESSDRKPTWTIVLQGENYSLFMGLAFNEQVVNGERIFGNDAFVYRKLQAVEQLEDVVVVYNLETTGSHSYIANGLSVHNCQYCGERFTMRDLNYDHVVPRKQGGVTTWENIATCCYPCNERKAGRTPEQAGMKLLRKPARPHALPLHAVFIEAGRIPPVWEPYLDWAKAQPHGNGFYLVTSNAA